MTALYGAVYITARICKSGNQSGEIGMAPLTIIFGDPIAEFVLPILISSGYVRLQVMLIVGDKPMRLPFTRGHRKVLTGLSLPSAHSGSSCQRVGRQRKAFFILAE
jgi:hypothetical protein